MDADVSHPPEQLPALVAPVLEGSYDVAIGSRYVPGGSTEGWPLHRRWLSLLGGWLARPLCDVNDATSGFFAFRRELAATIARHARGYKILLELLMAGPGKIEGDRGAHPFYRPDTWHLEVVIFTSVDLSAAPDNAGRRHRFRRHRRPVCGRGVVWRAHRRADISMAHEYGAGLALSHIMSFFAAATVNYTLNSKWSFRLIMKVISDGISSAVF